MQSEGLIRPQVLERRRQRLYGEVVLSDSRISSGIVFGLGAVAITLIGSAALATYPRTEKVPGIVVTSSPTAKVYAARSGVMERLFVAEGAIVRRGQPLALISVDLRDGTHVASAGESLVAIRRQGASLQRQHDAADQSSRDDARRLTQALSTNRVERASLVRQRLLQLAIVQSKSEELNRIGPAAERGFISRFEVDRRLQSLLGERQRLEQIEQQIMQLDGRQQELASELVQLPNRQLRQSAEFDGALGALAQQRARTSIDVGYTVVAPINGRVTALQTALGKGVDPRLPLMTVLPENADYQVQLFAPSKAVGFIRTGQSVRIAYDAFPYRQFGTFGGEILSISRMAYAPGELDVPIKIEEVAYPIRVRLANEAVPAFGRVLPLQSGMTLSANIVLERRSFLDWLLQPLNAVRKRT